MARRSILSATERDNLIALPNDDLVIQYYTFNESDLAIIQQHRGSENRLGFAVADSSSKCNNQGSVAITNEQQLCLC